MIAQDRTDVEDDGVWAQPFQVESWLYTGHRKRIAVASVAPQATVRSHEFLDGRTRTGAGKVFVNLSIRLAGYLPASAVLTMAGLFAAPDAALAQAVTLAAPTSVRNAQDSDSPKTQVRLPAQGADVSTLSPSSHSPGSLVSDTATIGKQFPGVLTFPDAIQRGLEYNLRMVRLTDAVSQALGQQRIARSALLPNITGDFSAAAEQVNLAALGLRLEIPGVFVSDVSRFNVVDLRARLSQTVVDLSHLNSYRAARESLRANEFAVEDSRDLIVQSVGAAYLEAFAVRARMEATRAQIETATTLHQRAMQQRRAGLATTLDINRAQVQMLTAQQRLAALRADLTKRKIDLARLIGLPATDQYELATNVPSLPLPTQIVDDALKQATERRADLKAAEAQVRAAERALAAAEAERLPSVSLDAEYGGNRASDKPVHSTYIVAGAVHVPLWQGGRAAGAIQEATAVLSQRRAELEDLKSDIEADVRRAYADLEAAATEVDVAQASLQVTGENLVLTRQRFDAGVSDNVSVVQSQESLAAAQFDYINSVLAHNMAKLAVARAIGQVSGDIATDVQLR
jgi:outer membrane protein TolC